MSLLLYHFIFLFHLTKKYIFFCLSFFTLLLYIVKVSLSLREGKIVCKIAQLVNKKNEK